MKNTFLIITSLLLCYNVFAQIKNIGTPPYLKNYTVEDYKGSNQVWTTVQSKTQVMYFGNNDGILEFDGKNWQKIKVNNNLVTALNIDETGKIFVGGKNEFGYLKVDSIGTLKYVSLIPSVPKDKLQEGNIWNIFLSQNNEVIFHSFEAIYVFQNQKCNVILTDKIGLFVKCFMVDNQLYIHYKNKGLAILVNNEIKIVDNSEIFATEMIKAIFKINDTLNVVTWSKGIFKLIDKQFVKTDTKIDDYIKTNIDNAYIIKNKYIAFGTIKDGVLITDYNFNPVQTINSEAELQNNSIRNIYLDANDNLWLCLENGISMVTIFSPFSKFDKNYGLDDCRTFAAKKQNDTLFIATSKGIFYKKWRSYEDKILPSEKFLPINNEQGSIKTFYINEVNNQLFATSSLGLFIINNLNANYILNNRGVRTFIQLKNNPDILIGGSDGLLLFKKENNRWNFKKNIANFNESTRFLEEDDNGYLWITNSIKGVFKIKLNEAKDSVVEYTSYDSINGISGLPSQLNNYVFNTKLGTLFGTQNGIYYYDNQKNIFSPLDILNKPRPKNESVVMIHQDLQKNIWYKNEKTDKEGNITWELGELIITDSGYFNFKTPFYKYKNKIFAFNHIDSTTYLIGAEHGFIHYDSKIENFFNINYTTLIRKIELINNDSIIFGGNFCDAQNNILTSQPNKEILNIDFNNNNIRFTFVATFYEEPELTRYKYILEGNNSEWSEWKTETVKDFTNLQPGNYVFKVKAVNLYNIESQIAEFKFAVKPPWYRTIGAYILYFLLLILFIYLIIKIYTRRLVNEKILLEKIVAERTSEIRAKNIELENQKEEIITQSKMLAEQNKEIKEKNSNITASIEYAKRIQQAMLPFEQKIQKHLNDYFILFKPRDIVSGDFYWFAEVDDKIIFTAVDCTGHGVPGAFMSMIGAEILTTIVSKNITDAAEILGMMNKYVRKALKQDQTNNQDGMDMALCTIDKKNNILEFSGAKNPLIHIYDNQLTHYKGDKQGIGGHQTSKDVQFTKHIINYQSPSFFYTFSDGYPDQFGGEKARKFMIKNLKDLLLEIHNKEMEQQKEILKHTIELWMQGHEQTDDILIIGFKI